MKTPRSIAPPIRTDGRLSKTCRELLGPTALLAALAVPVAAQQQFRELQVLGNVSGPFGFAMAAIDVDNDDDLDLVLAPWNGRTTLRVFENDLGTLTEIPNAGPALSSTPDDLAVGDIDGDGDVDIVMTEFLDETRMLLNDGTGRFTNEAARLPLIGRVTALALADIDLDGDPDLLTARDSASPMVLANRNGNFRTAVLLMPPLEARARRIRTADVNGDGYPDAFVATAAGDALWLNDGRGTLLDASDRLPANAHVTMDAQFGDVDGDGDTDLVLTISRPSGGIDADRVWLNDGTGRFTDDEGAFPADGLSRMSIALGDVDLDGDLDAIVGRWSDAPNELFLNDGTGRFDAAPGRVPEDILAASRHIAFADMDGDGDQDILVGNQLAAAPASPAEIWVNTHRHVHVEAPAVLGSRMVLELSNQPGYGTTFAVGIPLVGTARTALDLGGLGTLRVEPTGLAALDPVYLAPGTGTATTSIDVPNDPTLVGAEAFVQSLLVSPAGDAVLTNAFGTRVLGRSR